MPAAGPFGGSLVFNVLRPSAWSRRRSGSGKATGWRSANAGESRYRYLSLQLTATAWRAPLRGFSEAHRALGGSSRDARLGSLEQRLLNDLTDHAAYLSLPAAWHEDHPQAVRLPRRFHLPTQARSSHRVSGHPNPGTSPGLIRLQGIPEAVCAIVLIDGAGWPGPTARRAPCRKARCWPSGRPVAGG